MQPHPSAETPARHVAWYVAEPVDNSIRTRLLLGPFFEPCLAEQARGACVEPISDARRRKAVLVVEVTSRTGVFPPGALNDEIVNLCTLNAAAR